MNMKEIREYTRALTSKGQVTVPAEIRRLLDVKSGDQVVFRVTEDGVKIEATTVSLEDTFGAVRPLSRPENFAKLRQVAIEEHAMKTAAKMEDESCNS